MRTTSRHPDILFQRPLVERATGSLRNVLAAGGLAAAALGASTCASMLAPSTAEAQTAVPYGDVGLFIGWTWGAGGRGGFTWGIEGRGGADFPQNAFCPMDPMPSVAGIARFSFVELRPQLHLGMQGGVVLGNTLEGMLDLGVGYRFDDLDGGWSLPLGLEVRGFVASTFFRGDPLLEEVSTGGGAFVMPRMPQGCAIAGRALHDDAGHAPLPALARLGETRPPADLDRDLAEAIARAYEERARAEWASVPAFVQLATQLAAAGAPPSLRARALEAADDELRHALGTARAAMRFGGAPLALGRVTPATRSHATGEAALVRLAVESWIDGCVGEGRAAAVAAHEARTTDDADLRALQQTIAAEESRHAELAWDVLSWSLAQGGDAVRDAVHAAREAMIPDASADAPADLAAFGVLDARAQQAIADATRAHADQRLSRMLG